MATIHQLPNLTLHRGGPDPEEWDRLHRAAADALEDLYLVMPADDPLREACALLKGRFARRVATARA